MHACILYNIHYTCMVMIIMIIVSYFNNQESEGVTTVDMEEVAYLSKYRHPHIVQILGICTHKDQPAIVMELMEGGSLFTHLHVVKL